ncbi:crossover junction endodeoxyribonuclease RuvC [Dongia sp.]|uniref:crossover junction endodeoxyribonuclease RuvC n=1 Tax=Dongia sp. TaxID=1977262 RepID=UPI003750EF72
MRIIGLDPGLQHTGWGIIDQDGSRLSFVAAGRISSIASQPLAERLVEIHTGLVAVIDAHQPDTAAVEETFVNKNPTSTLKLGVARGVALLTPALHKLKVYEYPANLIKKSVVGAGHAGKEQVQMMVRVLLPASQAESPDAADALAVAICHAHHMGTLNRWGAKDFREALR